MTGGFLPYAQIEKQAEARGLNVGEWCRDAILRDPRRVGQRSRADKGEPQMVNRHTRDIAADVLQEFMEGSISNREYDRRFPKTKDDPALWAIYSNTWFCYSDTSEHTLTGKHALNDERRAILARCLMFLRSDLEFQWPPPKFRPWYGILRLLGLGRTLKRREQEEMSIGDVDVWPFLKKAQYEGVSHQ